MTVGLSTGDLAPGAIAGAAGTVALNVTTYLDMLLRGRPASQIPSKVAAKLTEQAGIDLASDDDDQAENRGSALGTLLGYVTGLGVGVVYGLVRPHLTDPPRLLSGLVVGTAVMAGSNVPPTVLGVTDPRAWGASGWLSDVVPHAVYGLVVVTTFDRIAKGARLPTAARLSAEQA
jgi:xanthosine utilization system XapX-like protein